MNRQVMVMKFDHLPKELRTSGFFEDRRINPSESVRDMLTVRPYPLDANTVADSILRTVGDIALVLYAALVMKAK